MAYKFQLIWFEMSLLGAEELENGNEMEESIEESEGDRAVNFDDPVSFFIHRVLISRRELSYRNCYAPTNQNYQQLWYVCCVC